MSDVDPAPVSDSPTATAVGARTPLDVGRGVLIGAAEVVPGVSGGTIALVTGVYDELIGSAGHVVGAARQLVTGNPGRARTELGRARWTVLVPLLAGMLAAVLLGAALLEPLVTEHPVGSRAVFLGLVLASLVVPVRMVGAQWSPVLVAVAVGMAALAAVLTGLPPADPGDPPLLLVSGAAAVAICALVLPGVSGSFLLATGGLYEPTLAAVNDRDLGYLAAFAAGAVVGLGLFVRLLQHLLTHHRAVTLAVMTGLMAGSLRALWPWQTDDRGLLGPDTGAPAVLGLALLGAAVVVVLLLGEALLSRRAASPDQAEEGSR